jgi:hypothetical protein
MQYMLVFVMLFITTESKMDFPKFTISSVGKNYIQSLPDKRDFNIYVYIYVSNDKLVSKIVR